LATLLDMTITHVPVLAAELIDALDPQPGDVVVDATAGGGGHARLVAERIGAGGTLIGIDRDHTAGERFAELAREVSAATRFIDASFVDGLRELRDEGVEADAVYFDLGASSMQIDAWERGFSYAYDAPLDMRMDSDQALSAVAVVNDWEERRLAQIFRDYGEERYARQIARAIARVRATRRIDSTLELVEVITAAIPTPARFAAGHPAKRVFQAIRIAVNDELGQLDAALPLAWELLAPAGASRRSPSTHSRTAASSSSWRHSRAAARVRPTCRSASAAVRPRPSCRAAAPPFPAPANCRRTRAPRVPGCAARASSRTGA
jgi:16S rRNA (cytosine1402-N4)-methyltransferase